MVSGFPFYVFIGRLVEMAIHAVFRCPCLSDWEFESLTAHHVNGDLLELVDNAALDAVALVRKGSNPLVPTISYGGRLIGKP